MNTRLNIIIAGGKTGGHLFPGIAVAQAVQSDVPNARFLFVGTDTPFEVDTLNQLGFAHRAIYSKPIKGGSFIHKLIGVILVSISLIQSLWILWSFKPDFVLGVGGFSSFAVVLAGRIMGVPTAIQEQNAVPGLTNRLLSRVADKIFTAFKATRGFENNPKVSVVGNPVRTMGHINSEDVSADLDFYSPEKPTIVVTGGSQGATSINNAFSDALLNMEQVLDFNIVHQTGIQDEARIKARYLKQNFKINARAFFNNLPQLFGLADMVVARAGAGTIAELSSQGAAVIFIPFPHAADDHQTLNARSIEKQGAAVVIEESQLSGKRLAQTIVALMNDKKRRYQMADTLKKLAMPDADKKIAAHIIHTQKTKA